MKEKYTHIYMVGVGGMGMTPLAIYLRGLGLKVTGTDDGLTEPIRKQLDNADVELVSSQRIPEGVDCVVHSSAIRSDHPSLQRAKARNLPMLRRGEMLANQLEGKKLLAIVGSHGKTTTAAMAAWILHNKGISVGYIGGGLFQNDAIPPAWVGDTEWVVAEIDESDGSMEYFSPHTTLLTNLDWDHADQYPEESDLFHAFARLFERTSCGILLPEEYTELFAETLKGSQTCEFKTFGETGDYQGKPTPGNANLGLLELGGLLTERTELVQAYGQFNLQNALAAFAACHSMGFNKNAKALQSFPGIYRRQTILHQSDSLTVLTDYAHHPTEISTLLESVRDAYPHRKIVAVFQPHRYTRTRQFKEAFAEQLSKADQLVVLPVYSAGEVHLEEGTSHSLRPYLDEAAEFLNWMPGRTWLNNFFDKLDEDSTVLFIGAGSVEKTARVFGAICNHQESIPQQWMGYLQNQISPETRLATQESLHNKNTMRIGGETRFFAEPASIEDLLRILESAAIFGFHHFLLGRGSNLIVSDKGFDGLILRLNNAFWREILPTEDGKLELGAGARLTEVASKACSFGMAGLEFLEGIPGTIGGAIAMNAGAMGSWIFDLVDSVTVLDSFGKVEVIDRTQIQFGYRCCKGLEGMSILRVTLTPACYEDSNIIRTRMDNFASRRKATQPRESSAGCIFRNPDGYFAGELIEEAGLKGERIGDAQVSEVHGNFLVNKGKAGYKDVIGLVRHVRKCVRKAYNLELIPEVQLLGEKWDNVL